MEQWAEVYFRNVIEGFPQYNNFQFVCKRYPKYSKVLKEAAVGMLLSEFEHNTVNRFLAVYKLPCMAVRCWHLLIEMQLNGIGPKGIKKTYRRDNAGRSNSLKKEFKATSNKQRKTIQLPKQGVSNQTSLICKANKETI